MATASPLDAIRTPGVVDVLSFGLGRFFSLYGAIGLLVCLALPFTALDDLRFAFAGDATRVELPAGSEAVTPNDFVEATLEPDYDEGIVVETLGGDTYTLVPAAGTGRAVVVYQQGFPTANEADLPGPRTYRGRVVGKGFFGEWDVNGDFIDVPAQFSREGIGVPGDVLVLWAGVEPRMNWWTTFVGLAGLAVLGVFGRRVGRTVRLLGDREALESHLRRTAGT